MIERLTALVIYVLLLLNVFNVSSDKFIDVIIIAQDSAKSFQETFLEKNNISSGVIGFLKRIRSLEVVFSRETFRRYLTAL